MLKTILIITLLILSTSAHTFLTHPPPRTNPTKPFTFGRGCSSGKDCFGPCESTTEEIIAAFGNIDEYTKWVPTFSGGEVLNVQWPRLNHPGGFVRLSLLPFTSSNTFATASTSLKTLHTCYESLCASSSPLGDPNGPGSTTCSVPFTIPSLPDGLYTLQFVWYGGGNIYGLLDAGFGEYYSCSDVIIHSSPTEPSQPITEFIPQPPSPLTSDYVEGMCKYWSDDFVGGECARPSLLPPVVLDGGEVERICRRGDGPKWGVSSM